MSEMFTPSGPVAPEAAGSAGADVGTAIATGDANVLLEAAGTVLGFLGPWGQTAAVALGALAAFRRPRENMVNAAMKLKDAVVAVAAIPGLKHTKDAAK
jgi:hypothetical protein